MSYPIIFGEQNRFAIEVFSVYRNAQFADLTLWISGERLGNVSAVYLSTFAGELNGVAVAHGIGPKPNVLVARLSDVELFALLSRVLTTGIEEGGFSSDDVWNYHYFYNIDRVVDAWDIFIVDDDCDKKILWRGKSESCPPHHLNTVRSARISSKDFFSTIEGFLNFVTTVALNESQS